MGLTFKKFEPDGHVGIVMLYGESGAGKTTIASTALLNKDLMGDVLFVDSDGGLGVLSSEHDHAILAEMNRVEDLELILKELTIKGNRRRSELQNVGTIVIDSLSAFKDKALRQISYDGVKAGKRPDKYVNQLQDWNKIVNILSDFLYQVKQTDYKVVVTAGQKTVTDENGVVTSMTPNLNAQAWNSTNYILSTVWRVRSMSDGRRVIQIFPSTKTEKNKTRANPEANRVLRSITDDKGRLFIPNYLDNEPLAVEHTFLN